MAKIGAMVLLGKSGEQYQFSIYPMDEKFEAVGAVYAVTRQYENEKGTYTHHVVYVGETGNLSTRFDNHHKAECFKEHKADRICIHPKDDKDSRLVVEGDLIKMWNPDCQD